jgi:hypothetical protein
MTRDDMLAIVEHYIGGASVKSIRESEDIQASSGEIEDFLQMMGRFVTEGIGTGFFDE